MQLSTAEMSLELQARRISLQWGFSPSHAQNREFGISFQVLEIYPIWFIPYKPDLQFRYCFSVVKGNKTGLAFVRREQHSDNVAFQGLWRLLLHQLYLCSPPSVLKKGQPRQKNSKERWLNRNWFCRQELNYGGWHLFEYQGHIFLGLPCLNLERKSLSWWNVRPVISMSVLETKELKYNWICLGLM